MKAIEQYFLVAPFVLLCKMVPTFESVDEVVKCAICMKMKAFQQHFNVLLSVSWYFANGNRRFSSILQRGQSSGSKRVHLHF